ncbi:MAG: hypothetical protein BAJATHORv1_40006 [Candidatus Thorarchaeota archaeon]|nr:MAG: hypothetical protein BAJATHORv1_40006 [Candidatus Thorarchaeota archaeon]
MPVIQLVIVPVIAPVYVIQLVIVPAIAPVYPEDIDNYRCCLA